MDVEIREAKRQEIKDNMGTIEVSLLAEAVGNEWVDGNTAFTQRCPSGGCVGFPRALVG